MQDGQLAVGHLYPVTCRGKRGSQWEWDVARTARVWKDAAMLWGYRPPTGRFPVLLSSPPDCKE